MSQRAGASTGTRTVLFTDVVGSTQLRTALGDAKTDAVRREHDRLLLRAVERHRGRLTKGLGDGVMAVFEAAADAAACAVAMQQAIDRFARKSGIELAIRVGLSAGDVAHEEDDWYGTPVVEAARLEAIADSGQIVASELVRLLAGSRTDVVFESLGSLNLKGLATPLPACSIRWDPLPAVGPLPMPGPLTSGGFGFVGREAEQQTLLSAWEAVADGQKRCVLVEGEAGIGKTRLAAELGARVHGSGAIVLAGRCDEDLAVPYQPFVEALRYFVDHAPQDLVSSGLGRYPEELARLVPEVVDRLPHLSEPLRSDPETERLRLFDAVVSWLTASAREQPLLLVVDDLQWAAKPTTALLRHLLRQQGPARLLVLGTYRPSDLRGDQPMSEFLADLHRGIDAERIPLDGLDDHAVAALLSEALTRPLTTTEGDLARRVRAETAGNPFYAGEVVRHAAETGFATGQPIVPETVRELVEQRMSRLSGAANDALVTAAVIGVEFDVPLLVAAATEPEPEILKALEEATRMRLVEELTVDKYRFNHALVREAIQTSLSESRRARLHRRAADAIELLHADSIDDFVVTLAHHVGEAARADATSVPAAIHYAQRAGDYSLAQLAPDDAVHWYRQALELLDRQSIVDEHRRGQLLVGLGDAQRQTGEPAHRETLLDAAALAVRLDDPDLLARAVIANSREQPIAFNIDSERLATLEAAREATEGAVTRERALVLATLATELTFCDRARVRVVADEAIALARRLTDDRTLITVITRVELAIRAPDNLAQRCALADEAIAAADRSGDPVLRWNAAITGADVAVEAGEVEAVTQRADVADQLAREIGQPFMLWTSALGRSLREVLAGRLDRAEQLTTEALEIGLNSGQPDAPYAYGGQLMAIRLHQGRLDELEHLIDQSDAPMPDVAAPVLRVLRALYYSEVGRIAEARRVLEPDSADGFSEFPFDLAWTNSMATYARVAATVGDRRAAARLVELLDPWRHQMAIAGSVVAPGGSIAHSLGLVLTTLGRYHEAEDAFAEAAAIHERIGAPILLANTRLEWARLLGRNDRDRERARELANAAQVTAAELGAASIERGARELLASLDT